MSVWATFLAIVYLERILATDKATRKLIDDKATCWLQDSGLDMQTEMEQESLKHLLADTQNRQRLL